MKNTTRNLLVLGHRGGIGSEVVRIFSEYSIFNVITPTDCWRYPDLPVFEDQPQPDIVVNCAGVIKPKDITDEEWYCCVGEFEVNVMLPMELMNLYPKALHINIGSSAADKPRAGWAGYCASKAALHSLIVSAADEGIRSYGVSPGRTATKMRTRVAGKEPEDTLLDPGIVAGYVFTTVIHERFFPNGSILHLKMSPRGYEERKWEFPS